MLDKSKLTGKQTVVKSANRFGNGWTFGNLLTLARNQPLATGTYTVLENIHPDLFSVYDAAQNNRLALPQGWSVQTQLLGGHECVANYYALWFHVPHGIRALWVDGGKPKELLTLMLSGYLQLGEKITFSVFQKYLSGRGLKYLPLVITPFQYRFFVYLPTDLRLALAVERFKEVLADLEGIGSYLIDFIQDAYALVRLDEVYERDAVHIPQAENEIGNRLYPALEGYKARLGYVYQDLPGPQDAKPFIYDMYSL